MDCEHQYIVTTKKRAVTLQGVLGVILFLAGAVTLVANVVVGGVLILVGIVIGMIGREKTVVRCAEVWRAVIDLVPHRQHRYGFLLLSI